MDGARKKENHNCITEASKQTDDDEKNFPIRANSVDILIPKPQNDHRNEASGWSFISINHHRISFLLPASAWREAERSRNLFSCYLYLSLSGNQLEISGLNKRKQILATQTCCCFCFFSGLVFRLHPHSIRFLFEVFQSFLNKYTTDG